MNLILEIEICHKTTGYNFSQRMDLEGKVIIKKISGASIEKPKTISHLPQPTFVIREKEVGVSWYVKKIMKYFDIQYFTSRKFTRSLVCVVKTSSLRSNRQRCSVRKGVLRNFANF